MIEMPPGGWEIVPFARWSAQHECAKVSDRASAEDFLRQFKSDFMMMLHLRGVLGPSDPVSGYCDDTVIGVIAARLVSGELVLRSRVPRRPVVKSKKQGDPVDLIFDGAGRTLILVSADGKELGRWAAANNVAIHAPAGEGKGFTNGPLQNGTYTVRGDDVNGAVTHVGGPTNGPYGAQGIIHIAGVKGASGVVENGAGIHSGRHGPDSLTAGCIRTTAEAMKFINATAKNSPIKSVTIKNNQMNCENWKKQAAVIKAAEAAKKGKK